MESSKRSQGLFSLIGNHADFLLIKLYKAKFILGKVKLKPMQPAALLSHAHVLRRRPFMSSGFLYYCLSFAFVADHCESFLCHFLQIWADSFCPTLSFPQDWSVHMGKHLVM